MLILSSIAARTTPTGKPIAIIAIARRVGDAHQFSRQGRDDVPVVKATWHDRKSGKREQFVAGKVEGAKTLSRVYASEADAQAAANGPNGRAGRKPVSLSLTLGLGRPDMYVAMKASVSDYKAPIERTAFAGGGGDAYIERPRLFHGRQARGGLMPKIWQSDQTASNQSRTLRCGYGSPQANIDGAPAARFSLHMSVLTEALALFAITHFLIWGLRYSLRTGVATPGHYIQSNRDQQPDGRASRARRSLEMTYALDHGQRSKRKIALETRHF